MLPAFVRLQLGADALVRAIKGRYDERVRVLLVEGGADPRMAGSQEGKTALETAFQHHDGSWDVIKVARCLPGVNQEGVTLHVLTYTDENDGDDDDAAVDDGGGRRDGVFQEHERQVKRAEMLRKGGAVVDDTESIHKAAQVRETHRAYRWIKAYM